MDGLKMNEKLYLEIFDEADRLFKKYNSGIKGQQLTAQDSFSYWIAAVAYKMGQAHEKLPTTY